MKLTTVAASALITILAGLVVISLVLLLRRGHYRRRLQKLRFVPCGELILVLVPHRDRDSFVEYLVPQLCTYLRQRHPCAVPHVLCVEQQDAGAYPKGLSWNVGLRYLEQYYGPNTQLVLNDADMLPRSNVSYGCPEGRSVVIWFQNTGGLKVRLGQMLLAQGFPMAITGWGYEDVAMWRRLERLADVKLIHWVEEIRASGGAARHHHLPVVLNLEWAKMHEEEAESNRKWYWGEDRKWVRMVQQSDPTWGVARDRHPIVPVPSKDGWFQEATRRRNEELDHRLRDLDTGDFRQIAEVDGLASLHMVEALRAVPFSERFPAARALPSGCEAWNLGFNSAVVLGETPRLFLEKPELGWYFDGPAECKRTSGVCGRGQSCDDAGVCMPV